MPEVLDIFSFDKGLNLKKNPVVLEEGELQTCSGWQYDHDGYLSALGSRRARNSQSFTEGYNIHRYMNWVTMHDLTSVWYKWDLNGYCSLYVPPNDNFTLAGSMGAGRCRTVDYNDWTFLANGIEAKAFTGGNLFQWGVDNPVTAPTAAAGSAGNPSGTYTLYYTFVIYFYNGDVVETGPSPAGTVTVSGTKIEWANIRTCPYPDSDGKTLIHRKLYRYSTALAATYFVYEIPDNTTTTYSDDFADGTVNTNAQIATTAYTRPAQRIDDLDVYYERIMGVKDEFLYWSQAYLPHTSGSTNAVAVTNSGDKLKAVRTWGDSCYMPSKSTWYRLAGSDPSTWVVKKTFAEKGIINTFTCQKTQYGILGLWYDGIYLFDGSTSKNITEAKIGKTLFTETITDLGACHAYYDGALYHFIYTAGGVTKCLIIDFRLWPELRMYHDPLVPQSEEYHFPSGIRYIMNTKHYYESTPGLEAMSLTLQTGEKVGQNITQRKSTRFLYYDIDTGGINVTVSYIVDGVMQSQTSVINTTTRTRDRIDTPQFEGYRIALRLTASIAGTEGLTARQPLIYSPWALQSVPVGK